MNKTIRFFKILGVGLAILTGIYYLSSAVWAVSTLSVPQGGTGAANFSANGLIVSGTSSTSPLVASSSPTVSTITATSTASSTFSGGISTAGLASSQGLTITGNSITDTSAATSAFSNGLNLSAGCFAVNGTCVGGGVSSVTAANGTLTISPTTGAVVAGLNLGNANLWSGLQEFSRASTTQLTTGFLTATSSTASIFTGIVASASSTFSAGLNTPSIINLASNGFIKTSDGTGALSVDTNTYLTAAITSLNGLTGSTQTFATTTNNGGWGFSSSGTTHTLNIPTASLTNPLGLLSAANFGAFNNKVGTSSSETAGYLAYFTTTNGTPALIGSTATGTVSASGGITATAGQSIIGSGLTIGCSVASGSTAGCLATTDWSAFNNKIGTSSSATAGNLAYFTTTNGTPALLSDVATTSASCTSPISCAAFNVLTGGGAITLTTVPVSIGGTNNTAFGSSMLIESGSAGTTFTSTSSPTVGNITATGTAIFAGKVGIGTTSPTSLLNLDSAATTTLRLGTSGIVSGTCIEMISAIGTQMRTYIGSANTLVTEAGACQ